MSTNIRTYTTPGIILKRRNFGEADRLLTIYTPRFGKLTCIAKGVRKLTSRKKASLELFTHAKLFLAKGKNLDLVTEAETINSFPQLRRHLRRTTTAYQVVEVLDRLTRDGQTHLGVFELLIATLHQLTITVNPQTIILNYQIQLLKFLGFGLPQLITPQTLTSHIETIIDRPLRTKAILE